MKRYLMKNPHWTPEQERQIELAERLSTRAEIFELGEVREVLSLSIALRKQSSDIHEQLRPLPRSRKSQPSPKASANKKGRS